MAEASVSIVIADDHTVVRSGLRMILEAEADFEVIGEASDVEGVIRKTNAFKPAVLVLDINMGGASSLDSLDRIAAASPETAIVVLTMQEETSYAREAMSSGATGYLLKDAADTELVVAVRKASSGERHVQPSIGARLASETGSEWPPDGLSERELDVLRLIALGHTNREIGEGLHLSLRTVESHRLHIQQKLSLQTRAELVGYALDNAVIDSAR